MGGLVVLIPESTRKDRGGDARARFAPGPSGLPASRDTPVHYEHSMAEAMPPFGKLNRWWHGNGLPRILAAYLNAVRPTFVVDPLSLEYREAVSGYAEGLQGLGVQ